MQPPSGDQPLILIHQYFWPDSSPYGNLLRGIAEHLAEDGYAVTILTTQPNYGSGTAGEKRPACEQIGKLTIRRTWGGPAKKGALLRILTSLWFCWFIVRQLIGAPRGARVMHSTMPPVLGAATARWMTGLRGGKFVYHLMDIYPESAEFVGMVKPNLLTRLLRTIDQRTVSKASAVVALSEDMLTTLRARGLKEDRHLSVIDNYAQPSFDDDSESIPEGMGKAAGRFRILFAGNIGHFQRLETVIEAAGSDQLADVDDVEFVFVGEGKALEGLKRQAKGLPAGRVQFFPRQSAEVAEQMAAESDLCLVTLAENIYRVAFPSKTATCLCSGRPLLVVAEPDSVLSGLCSDHGAGVACAPGDADSLANAVADLRADRDKLSAMAKVAAKLGRDQFSRAAIFPRWSRLMSSL